MSIYLLVVLYGCKTQDSATIESFLSINRYESNFSLVIWNNGPNAGEVSPELLSRLSKKGINAICIQTPFNAPLSWIYNFFLKNFSSEIYLLADHDSTLSAEYLEAATSVAPFFARLPIIQAQGISRSPTVKGEFSEGPFRRDQKVISIGSGTVLSRDAVREIEGRYGSVFDEHFALYGVDTSFFLRIYKAGLADRLETIPGFEHSLSRLEKESDVLSKFRRTERTYDFALMLRHYPSRGHLKSLVKQALLLLVGRSRLDFGALIKTLITGRHPRATEQYRQRFNESLRQFEAQSGNPLYHSREKA